jgi:hypothetical protein
MNPLQCSLECLRRTDLPVGTMELAQSLIGKTLVHELPTARLSGASLKRRGIRLATPPATPSEARHGATSLCFSVPATATSISPMALRSW